MGTSAFFGLIAGIYQWYPKMFGRMMNERLGIMHFWISFIGIYLVFIPLHFVGMAGFPRRYYAFTNFDAFSSFADLNAMVTLAAIVTFLGQFLFLFNFVHSYFYGRKAPLNPWGSNSLEWTTPTAVPGHGNWPGELPTVHRWPYDYSNPHHEQDFVPQTTPLTPQEKASQGS